MFVSQIVANSIIAGSIYALVAVGFSLIYSLQKFFHIAHGGIYVVAAFVAWWLAAPMGLPFAVAFVAAVAVAIGVGIVIDQFIYKPIRKRPDPDMPLFLASFGAFLFLQNAILLFFGADVKTFGLPIERGMDVFGAIITKTQVLILIVAAAAAAALWWFLKRTKTGKVMRATADDKTLAELSGIRSERVSLITVALGSALAALAGILISLEQNLEQSMGLLAVLKGITAAIVGGIGNVGAAIIGAYFIGFAENFGILALPSGYKDAIAFAVLIVFLLVRPQGFFGTKIREK